VVRLVIDFEFTSRVWWDAGGQELWDAIAESFDGSGVLVDPDLAESWLAQARDIEGWDAGTEYAPHPVRTTAVDEDDPEL
jgi:hypothetical protein